MASVGTVYMDVAYNVGQISKDLTGITAAASARAASVATRTFDQAFVAIGSKAASLGKDMTTHLSLPIVGLGALAVREFTGYEKALTNIQGLVGASREQTQSYAEDIRRIGVEFGIGAQAAGEALYFITSSGFEGAAAIQVLEESSKAAATGLGEVPVIADLVTSAITAYGASNLSAAEAVDILTVAVREGKGDPAELAGAMARVLPIASQLGVSFDQVAGAFASMSLTGADANEVATQVRQIMASLLTPTKEGEEALLAVGTSYAEIRNEIAQRGLLPALESLKQKLGDNSEATAAVFGDVRALTGIYTILGENLDSTRQTFAATADATGALDDAFAVTEQSAAFKLDTALASLQDTLVELGAVAVPVVEKMASGAATLAKGFDLLPGPVQSVVVGLAGVVAIAGPLLYVGGKLASAIGKITQAGERLVNASIDKAVGSIGRTSESAAPAVGGLSNRMSRFTSIATAGTIAVTGLAAAWGLWDSARRDAEAAASSTGNSITDSILKADDIDAAQRKLDELRRQIEGLRAEAAKATDGSLGLDDLTEVDFRADVEAAIPGYEAIADAQQRLIDQSKELAPLTGRTADEMRSWLAEQALAGTTFDSTQQALEAYLGAVSKGEIVVEDAAAAQTRANAAYDQQRQAVSGLMSAYLGAIDGGRAYEDALAGIGDAQRAAEQATHGVTTAQRAYRDSLRSVEDAQDSYHDSLEDVADAQRDVADAQRRLDESLNGPSEDDELSLEAARIRLEEARRAMNPEGGFEDDLERRRAALALRQAELDLARLEEQVAGRPEEAALELAEAQDRLTDAQSAEEEAARRVADANLGVAEAARGVRDAQYDQAKATEAIRDAQDDATRAAFDLYNKQGDLQQIMRDETGASQGLLDELTLLKDMYPELAGAIQPYIDKLRILQALRDAASGRVAVGPDTRPRDPADLGWNTQNGVGSNALIGGDGLARGNGVTIVNDMNGLPPEEALLMSERRQSYDLSLLDG
jgi:TP901 family phage tail tape measure protein